MMDVPHHLTAASKCENWSMAFVSQRERRLWILVALYALSIYATLAVMRRATNFLRDRNLLQATIGAVALLVAVALVAILIRERPGKGEWLLYAVIAAGYLAVLPLFKAPEEQLHLIEYGALGGLIYSALEERRRLRQAAFPDLPLPHPYRGLPLLACSLATALGFVDEVIQWVLPSRFFDLRDVGFNALAAALAVAALAGRAWVRAKNPAESA